MPEPAYNAAMKFERSTTVATTGERAIDLLAAQTPELSKQQLKQAMQQGAVWLKPAGRKTQKRLRRVTHTLTAGDSLSLHYDSDLLAKKVEPAQLVGDEHHYSVWDKPAGLLAQGTLFGDHCSLLYFVEQHFKPRRHCFLVHRLDSAASGLMLVAHSERAAAAFSQLFQQRAMTKHYRVTVEGLLDKNCTLIHEPLDGKEAITRIEQNTELENGRSELRVLIETGRKHQIRRHLAGVGHPVIGDREYGSAFTKEALQLRAIALAFTCPISQKPRSYSL